MRIGAEHPLIEAAARALCSIQGITADAIFADVPGWYHFVPDVYVMLRAMCERAERLTLDTDAAWTAQDTADFRRLMTKIGVD